MSDLLVMFSCTYLFLLVCYSVHHFVYFLSLNHILTYHVLINLCVYIDSSSYPIRSAHALPFKLVHQQ